MSDRIRLLLTIPDLSGGGAERELVNLARGLSRERFDVHLLLHRSVFVHPAPDRVKLHVLSRTKPWHTPRTVREIADVVDRLRPDLVFSQLHYANLLTGSALARARHRPRWVCRHTGDPRRELRGPFAAWARRVLPRADVVAGCGEGVSDALREHLHLDARRVVALPNVVDAGDVVRRSRESAQTEGKPGAFTVVHAGRFVAQKNQALLLDAFARLAPTAELWMLGEGPLRRRLMHRALRLGVNARVRWLGFRANPFPWFRSADVFALTSDTEGFPNAVVEAALCGTPTVATRCRYGPEEIIEDGVDGRLAPPGDVATFAQALARLAAQPDELRAMGARAHERAVARFGFAKAVAAYESLFERVLATTEVR